MSGDSACAGHGGDGGFCHLLLSPRDACPDLYYHHSPCKRARHWAPPALTDSSEQPATRRHQQEHRRFPPVDNLPDECLSEILVRLEGTDERAAASCVSRRWLNVLSAVRGKRRTPRGGNRSVDDNGGGDGMQCGHDEGEEEAAALTRCLGGKEATDLTMTAVTARANGFFPGGLGKLIVLGQPGDTAWRLTDAGLTVVARGSPSLRTLSVSHAPFVTDVGLCEIANGCTKLQKLELSRCPMVTGETLVAIASKCPNLSSLTIEHCPKIGDRGLQAVGRCCRNLQTFSLVGCSSVGDQGVASLVCSASSSLTKIKLQSLNITDVCLAVIGLYGKTITDMSLAGLRGVNERGFWIMGNARGLGNLKSILINGCPGLTDLGVEAMAKGCPSIRKLCLRRCCSLSDVGLRAVAASAKMLGDLQLEECNKVTSVGVLGAAGGLKALSLVKCMGIEDAQPDYSSSSLSTVPSHLRSLTVRDCPGFGDACLTNIRKLCPSLLSVDLSGRLGGVTDAGILHLIGGRNDGYGSGLVKVDLRGCAAVVDDRVVSALAKAHGATLKVLNLAGCRNVSDDGLLDIVASCHVLQDLDVSTSSVTDAGVAALASAVPHLRVLSLSGCSVVSDGCLPFIKNVGKSLTGLNLLNCNQIAESAARLLHNEMDWCDIIF